MGATPSDVIRTVSDPAAFARWPLNRNPWSAQERILRAIRDHRKVTVKSCHGIGKDWTSACAVLWFGSIHPDSLIITTAPTDRQVRGILWHEIADAVRKASAYLGGYPNTQEFKWMSAHAIGFATRDYDDSRFQGWHRENVLVVVDEAAGVTQQIYDGISGVMSSEGAKLLLIGNPTDPTGEFARSFKDPTFHQISISAFDTPNFTAFGITQEDIESGEWEAKIRWPLPCPYLVTPEWVADRWRAWGKSRTDPRYQSRVLAQFPDVSPDTLIPMHLIERAKDFDWKDDRKQRYPSEIGVDVARYGDDDTVIVYRHGPRARVLESVHGLDTVQVAGRVAQQIRATGAHACRIDEIGIGAGVVDILRRTSPEGCTIIGVNVGRGANDSEQFANQRAELFWGLRQRFEEGEIDIDPDDIELHEQLHQLRYAVTPRGQIKIESKDEAKKKGDKSPDKADALMLAFAAGYEDVSGLSWDDSALERGNVWSV